MPGVWRCHLVSVADRAGASRCTRDASNGCVAEGTYVPTCLPMPTMCPMCSCAWHPSCTILLLRPHRIFLLLLLHPHLIHIFTAHMAYTLAAPIPTSSHYMPHGAQHVRLASGIREGAQGAPSCALGREAKTQIRQVLTGAYSPNLRGGCSRGHSTGVERSCRYGRMPVREDNHGRDLMPLVWVVAG